MDTAPSPTQQAQTDSRLWSGYVVPMALFMALTFAEGAAPKAWYFWLYIAKVCVVTAALVAFRAPWRDIRFEGRALAPGLLVGLAVFAEWVLIEKYVPYPHFLGERVALDPFSAVSDPMQRGLFLTFRLFGLALMVPVMEELFWRSFLIRWITVPDFASLPIGAFSWTAFWAVAGLFGLAHPEWLVAVLCACAYGLLLRGTRSLFACVVAHATTNLALGIYVLLARDWRFW